MTPEMITQAAGSPFRKFASWFCPKNELNRSVLSAAFQPDWPPSP